MMITIPMIDVIESTLKNPGKKAKRGPTKEKEIAAKIVVDRVNRVKDSLNDGNKLTPRILANIESISRSTATKDLKALLVSGFAKFVTLSDGKTKLYSLA